MPPEAALLNMCVDGEKSNGKLQVIMVLFHRFDCGSGFKSQAYQIVYITFGWICFKVIAI